MTRRALRSRVFLLAGLALAVAAVPRSGAAGESIRATRAQGVSFAPLFDTAKRFKPKETFHLRFRVADKRTRSPIDASNVSFLLRHGTSNAAAELPARELKKGVFEVPFAPDGPGQYWVVAAVRGVPAGSIPAVRLGVVGVVDGLIEVGPEGDLDVKHQKGKLSSRSR